MNMCIKTGADVLLTSEGVEAHGDLYYFSDGGGEIGLVLHYTPHFKSVPSTDYADVWPDRFDAVIDTKNGEEEQALDLQSARVMVFAPAISYLSKRIPLPEGVVGQRDHLKEFANQVFGLVISREGRENDA